MTVGMERCDQNKKTRHAILRVWGVLVFFVSSLFFGCQDKRTTEVVQHDFSLDSIYTMFTDSVDVLISDSGCTQYRMKTLEWYVYEKRERPCWYFPKGFYAEKFDEQKKKLAQVKSDTAYYYMNEELWDFIGHVSILNLAGERFTTQHLYWDKNKGRVFSDDTVRIEGLGRSLVGSHFEASQNFEQYTFYNNVGQMDVKEEESPQ
ncbi:MAG: LPS export ABC transporter periplasmic protein LptC [Porphyromonas sp.]|nr:LPS export ABC transporter periplasmic protein LptC [Porphyromonas sp.]MDY3101975.1 LPS export ABC transporter periplasmic protein LptC [Porphyromonas sp.]